MLFRSQQQQQQQQAAAAAVGAMQLQLPQLQPDEVISVGLGRSNGPSGTPLALSPLTERLQRLPVPVTPGLSTSGSLQLQEAIRAQQAKASTNSARLRQLQTGASAADGQHDTGYHVASSSHSPEARPAATGAAAAAAGAVGAEYQGRTPSKSMLDAVTMST